MPAPPLPPPSKQKKTRLFCAPAGKTLEVATRAGADVEERLTLVEASVRVLPAVDPAQGSVLLMRLLSPLLHVLAQGLQSTSPDEAAVRDAHIYARKPVGKGLLFRIARAR